MYPAVGCLGRDFLVEGTLLDGDGLSSNIQKTVLVGLEVVLSRMVALI